MVFGRFYARSSPRLLIGPRPFAGFLSPHTRERIYATPSHPRRRPLRPLGQSPAVGAFFGHARHDSICRASGQTLIPPARRRQTGSHTTAASNHRENRRFPWRIGPRLGRPPPRTPAVWVPGWG